MGGIFMFKYLISQIDHNDCGFTCLKILLANINNDKEYLFLKSEHPNKAYSFKELIAIANNYDLTLNGFRVIDKNEIVHNTNYPLIVTLDKEEGKHAVILTKIIKNKAIIIDPEIGEVIKIPLEEFLSLWDSLALGIEEYRKKKCPCKSFEPITKTQRIVLVVLQMFSFIFLTISTCYLQDETKIVSIASFCTYVLFEIIYKLYTKKVLEYIDNNLLIKDINIHYNSRLFYTSFIDLKKSTVLRSINVIYNFMVVILILLIFITNNTQNLFLLIPCLVISLCKVYFVKPKLRKINHRIVNTENKIFSEKKGDKIKPLIKKAQNDCYQYWLIHTLFEIVSMFVFILSGVILLVHQGTFKLQFVVSFTCLMYLLTKNIISLFSHSESKKEYYKAKAIFNNETY